jgi:putative ABC transport system permease protein
MMRLSRLLPLALKGVVRARGRSLLTVAGVAAAMCLFASIQALMTGVEEATKTKADDTTLIVYRENRFCPFTSKLPQRYDSRIREIPGVTEVMPMRIAVSNCRASLDVVTFRGVRKDDFVASDARRLTVRDGSLDDWLRRSDAALVGRTLAERRGVKSGDRFRSGGVTVTVAAVFESDEPQDQNVAYVDLEFLQRAPGIDELGIVTQFEVHVEEASQLDSVAAAIDAAFANDEQPTATRPEKAFVARVATDILELVGFAGWVAMGCLAAVLALVANAIVLSVHDRVRDFAIMQTLGFTPPWIGILVVLEASLLGVIGGLLGTAAGLTVLRFTGFALSSDGLSFGFTIGPSVWGTSLLASVLVGVAAGLVPAWRAARTPMVESFRAV